MTERVSKLNSIICASVPLLGLDNELMSFGPAQCHLYLFSYGNFEIAEVFLTRSQGGPGVLAGLSGSRSVAASPGSEDARRTDGARGLGLLGEALG